MLERVVPGRNEKGTPGGVLGLNDIYRGMDNAIFPAQFPATTCTQHTKSPHNSMVSDCIWIDDILCFSHPVALGCYCGVSTGCNNSLRMRNADSIQGSLLIPGENIFPEGLS